MVMRLRNVTHMANLDRIFHALADPTRRAVVERLTAGPQSVGALSEPFAMALPSFLKHLRVLEAAGLIVTDKQGRVRRCRIADSALLPVEGWLADQRALWEGRATRLAEFVEDDHGKERE